MKTTIKKWGINGEGIAYYHRKPVFIPYALPQEEIEYHIVKETRKYCIGEMDRLITQSARRRYPLCSKWQTCGGCALMHTQYKEQCKMKSQMVKEALRKYTKYQGPILPIIKNPDPLGYRNMCKLPLQKINGHWQTGMYEANTHDFVAIDRCFIHEKQIELVRKAALEVFDQYQLKDLETLVLKVFDQKVQMILVTKEITVSDACITALSAIDSVVSIWQSIKKEESMDTFGDTMIHLSGTETMELTLGAIHCQLLPRSFFQLNTKQALRLYQLVQEWTPNCNTIMEAYCGIGAMSLFVADKAESVWGIEYNRDAIENAKINAQWNHCDNVSFLCGDANEKLMGTNESIDCLIVDPPRKGLESMVNTILQKQIPTILYVSCNPSTLAKDLAVLTKQYTIQKVQPLDMFSQTPLVETIIYLERKSK